MNDLIAAKKLAEWQRLKALVLDSVSLPVTRRYDRMALDKLSPAWLPKDDISKQRKRLVATYSKNQPEILPNCMLHQQLTAISSLQEHFFLLQCRTREPNF